MITGTVNANLEPLIELAIRDASGQDHSMEAVVDTGFNGTLTLPSAVITRFGLPWLMRSRVILADGRRNEVDVHSGTVTWEGTPRHVLIEAAESAPLVGMDLLERSVLKIEVVEGGGVLIEPMP